MATKKTKKTAPKKNAPTPELGVLALLKLVVDGYKGVYTAIETWIPVDLPLLEQCLAAVADGGRTEFNVSPDKAFALYKALRDKEHGAEYGTAEWLTCKAACREMNSMKAYRDKAGPKASYKLQVTSKPRS